MPERCILLTGAPLSEDLDWSDESLLQETVIQDPAISLVQSGQNSTINARWRAVSLDTSITISHPIDPLAVDKPGVSFLSSQENGIDITEASIIFFEDNEVSELPPVKVSSIDGSFADTEVDTSFLSAASHAQDEADASLKSDIETRQFTDLKATPDHLTLQRLAPQTVTIDLLVAVVAVLPTKIVQLRRSNDKMEIVEVIVGDDTQAGLSINVWLRPEAVSADTQDDLRRVVRNLRPGDVLAAQNVALAAFRDKVYGQTLSRRMNRNTTTFKKISRTLIATSRKLEKVRCWATQFVKDEEIPKSKAKKRPLPPDSQSD